jgi:hypothetical protein
LKWLHSNVGEPISLSVALDHLDPDDPYGSSWFYEKMQPTLSVIDHVPGRELRLRTASSYSMNSTIAILEFLEDVMHAEIADASWKRGYGLPVATAIRICIKDVDAGLVTDGSDLCIRRYSGDKRTFEELCAAIRGRFESAL